MERYFSESQMPQKRKPTPDDYWGAADKELVALRGSFEYCSRLLCGDTIAITSLSSVQHTRSIDPAFEIRRMVYTGEPVQVVLDEASATTTTTDSSIQVPLGWTITTGWTRNSITTADSMMWYNNNIYGQ